MDIAQLQGRIGVTPTGIWTTASDAALLAHFSNKQANAISEWDFAMAADRIGCTVRQIKAVRAVEAAGSGFDAQGRPKILFERHLFHRMTGGRFSPAPFSNSVAGGYSIDADRDGVNDNWEKLLGAIAVGAVDAAFQACSWGAFQVLGQWWDELGYPSPYALAWTTAQSEGDQLELLVRFIERFGLADEIRAINGAPINARAFAAAYNGPGFRKYRYDERIAAAWVAGKEQA